MPSLNVRTGTRLLDYRIEAVLGRGGMSVVYLAEDLRLRRKVALKLLAAELAEDERFRERFLRESELAASIDHPNVVPIYDAGEAEGLLYIAMRYVAGTDLKVLLRREGALDPVRAHQQIDKGHDRSRLTSAGCHDQECLALLIAFKSFGDTTDGALLVEPLNDGRVYVFGC